MAIENFMASYKVYENVKTKDKFGAEITTEQYIKDTIASIHMFTSNEQMQNERYAEVTHFGLTKDKTLHLGQVLQSEAGERYVIHLPVNHITPYSQLHLKRIENYG